VGAPGSPQRAWIEADLAAVDRTKTPWLFLFQHRPLLCSTTSEEGDHVPGGKFLTNLEALILAHNVDVVITGCARGRAAVRPRPRAAAAATSEPPNNASSSSSTTNTITLITTNAIISGIECFSDFSAKSSLNSYICTIKCFSGHHILCYRPQCVL
jgi:hypothetical protein